MKRYIITVPIEIGLNAKSEQDARVELLKIRNEIKEVYYLGDRTAQLRIRTEKAKVKELPF